MSKFYRCDRCKDEIPASEIRFLDRSKEREGQIDETFELCYSCDAMLTTFLSGESMIIAGAVAISEHRVQAGTQMVIHKDAFATTMAPLPAAEPPPQDLPACGVRECYLPQGHPGEHKNMALETPPNFAPEPTSNLLDDDIPF